jgi:hypothetical protein
MSFKVGTFVAGATVIAATVAYFITVPPVESHSPRSASEFGGETSMNWSTNPRDSTYPFAPETYQYIQTVQAPPMRLVSRPVVRKVYVYRRNPCKPRKQLAWNKPALSQ